MIILVRHGEAAASWGEHPDPGLSELGRKQAQAVADHLQEISVKTVLTSPMQRCRETALPFAELSGLSPIVTPEVSEIPTPKEVMGDRVAWLKTLMSGTWAAAPSVVLNWRDKLLAKIHSLPDNTVVFTHFVAINAVVSALEGQDNVMVFRPSYCSQTILDRTNGRLKVKRRGDEAATRVL